MIDRFREEAYQSYTQRADAGGDLIDALASLLEIASPTVRNESPLSRRKFSSTYDLLNYGEVNVAQRIISLGQVLGCVAKNPVLR
jgi:hypothetical protein